MIGLLHQTVTLSPSSSIHGISRSRNSINCHSSFAFTSFVAYVASKFQTLLASVKLQTMLASEIEERER